MVGKEAGCQLSFGDFVKNYVLGVDVDENSGGGRNTRLLLYKFCKRVFL